MPEFEFEGRRYHNPVELALTVIGGKWKMPILWRLRDRVWRYNELRRDLKRISHKMLTQELRGLERAGLITRTVHAVVPPRVDYEITSLGSTTGAAIEALRSWGALYRRRKTTSNGAAALPQASGPLMGHVAWRADSWMLS